MEGHVITYKARLVSKGYHQRQKVEYDETFGLITMLKSIKILFISAHYYYEIDKWM